MKLVLGLLFTGYIVCLCGVLADAVVGAVMPWLYHEDSAGSTTCWTGLSPMMYCLMCKSGSTTSGECKDSDQIGCKDENNKDVPLCIAMNDGEAALALFLIGAVLGAVCGLLTLFELCCGDSKRRPVRIVAYIFFIVMFVFCIAATAIEADVCNDYKEATHSDDDYWDMSSGFDCAITAIVLCIPAAALYIVFVLLRNKLGK